MIRWSYDKYFFICLSVFRVIYEYNCNWGNFMFVFEKIYV